LSQIAKNSTSRYRNVEESFKNSWIWIQMRVTSEIWSSLLVDRIDRIDCW